MRSAASRLGDLLRPENCAVLLMEPVAGAVAEALAAAIQVYRLPVLSDFAGIHRNRVSHFDPGSVLVKAIEATGRRKWIVWGDAAEVGALAAAMGQSHEVYLVFEGSMLRDGAVGWKDLAKLVNAGVIVCNWAAVEAQLLEGSDWDSDYDREGTAMRIGPGQDGGRRFGE